MRTADLKNTADMQSVIIAKRSARYMRLEIVSKIDGTASNACLAELGVGIEETYLKSEYDAMAAFLELPVEQTTDKFTAITKANWTGKEIGVIAPILRINGTSFNVSENGEERTFSLITNVKSWKSWKGADWVSILENREGGSSITLTVPENNSLESRGDTIYVAGAGILRKLPVMQTGYQIPVDLIPTDHYIKPSGGKSTTQYTSSHSITNLWDRNPDGANYHTAVNNDATPKTETLEFLFSQKPAVIDYLIYVHAAGTLDKMTIYSRTGNSTEYVKLGEFDWNGVSKFKFPEPLKDGQE